MDTFEDFVAVSDAAARLGVSDRRVRQLLEAGTLAGRRFGSQWLVDAASLRDTDRRRRSRGRPLNACNAWKLIVLASGQELPRGHASERARLRQLLATKGGLLPLVPALGRRGDPVRLAAHPGVLNRLAEDDAVVLSGARASLHHHLGLGAVNDLEGYVRAGALPQLQRRYALERASDGNVLLRVIPDDIWFPPGKHAPLAAVAVDLAEGRDPRSREVGQDVIADLDRSGLL